VNPRVKHLALPLGGALVAASVAGGAFAGTAGAEPDLKSATLAPSANAQAIAGYWTSSKLKSAKTYLAESTATGRLKVGGTKASADGRPGIVAPTGEGGKSAGRSKNVNLPITVGKVFFLDDKGQERWCSGTSIQSKYRNLVATAGHCVYDTDTNKPFSNFVFIPGYYQGKAPWGIYVGARVNMHHDFDVYEDYDYDYAFVNVYNGIKQTGVKEVNKSTYTAAKGFKYTEDRAISKDEFEKGYEKYGELGPYWKKAVDPTVEHVAKPADAAKYIEEYVATGRNGVKLTAVEVVESVYDKAPKGLENGNKFERKTVRTPISKEEYDKLVKQKADGGFLGKLEVTKDVNGTEIAWFKSQYFVKKWVKTTVKELYFHTRYFVITLADAGRLGDNVGGQGFSWNQKLGKKVFTFGYPAYAHLDGHKPYSGHTMKWCYGTTGNAPDVAKYKAEEHQAIKCAFTPGASGSPFLLQYKNSKRTGYVNGVVSLTIDSDGNDRYDRVTTPYFNGETYGIYKSAANRWTGKLPS
jgi:V8-like Glu-specific endopeptidase